MNKKIGVYICQCGSNISDVVDVEKVKEVIAGLPGVFVLKVTMFACSDSAQNEMIEDIRVQQLDGLVVASCSPKLHVPTFRNVAKRAGLNPYQYVQVNIREQCSWSHSDQPAKATEKAIQLVKAGITKVQFARALNPIEIEAENAVAVIGTGITGLRIALGLAALGTRVYLLERDHFVGGRIPQWGRLIGSEKTGKELIDRLYRELSEDDRIELFTGVEMESMNGSVGNFTLNFTQRPRYIKDGAPPERIGKLIEECPVSIPDPFNFSKTEIPAVNFRYPGAKPETPAVDLDALKGQEKYLENFGDCIDPGQSPEEHQIRIGAVILATGFDPYTPAPGEFGYGNHPDIITLEELRRNLETEGRISSRNGKEVRQIAFIFCVGSCQVEGENKYCSRICCTTTLDTSIQIKKSNPEIQCFHLYRHIRTYGKQELIYEEASRNRDLFLKFSDDDPPVVNTEQKRLSITINDLLTMGMEIEIQPDLLVLVTGMVPAHGSDKIAKLFKAPLGRDRFFNEVHPKLRPVETVIDGIFIAGTSQGPKNIPESVKSGLSAVSKTNALLREEKIELDPTIATIDPVKCTWCDLCSNVCPFDAIKMEEHKGKKVAVVMSSSCKGCGMCNPVCPVDAIDLIGYTNAEVEGMIDSLISMEI
jgi:heterodisulfide reductase subunit A